MSFIIFNCEFCKYKTKRKYDLNRHQLALHYKNIIKQIKIEEIKEEEIKEEIKVEEIKQEEIKIEEIKEEEIKQEEIYNCIKCDKKYKTKKYFIEHEKICNGLNILTCPKCMKSFSSYSNKSTHIKNNNCIANNIIDNKNKEFIYLLQEREFINNNEPIYKIGKTKQKKLKRIKSYSNGSELLFYIACNNCDEIEKLVLNKFKNTFIHKKDIGNEYFMGNYNIMIDIIYNIIRLSNNNQNIENNICSKCNKFYKTKKYLIIHESKCNGLIKDI
jgi:hypothetical protein